MEAISMLVEKLAEQVYIVQWKTRMFLKVRTTLKTVVFFKVSLIFPLYHIRMQIILLNYSLKGGHFF